MRRGTGSSRPMQSFFQKVHTVLENINQTLESAKLLKLLNFSFFEPYKRALKLGVSHLQFV